MTEAQGKHASFRTMNEGQPVRPDLFVRAFVNEHPDCLLYVGCDSQNLNRSTLYVTTIVLRLPGMGAKVLYRKEKVPRIADMWTKLWGETERSVELANYLRETCKLTVHQIDLDFNEDPSFASHKLLNASAGYVKSMGFDCASKPSLLMAVWAANALCK